MITITYVLGSLGLLALLSYLVLFRVGHRRAGVSSYSHIESFLGLDLFFSNMWRKKQLTHITVAQERHEELGHTFTSNQLGTTMFHTVHHENIRAIFSTASADWHVGPARLRAMEPFCGRGFLTTDGEEWEGYRNMLKPLFERSFVDDLTVLASSFDELLDGSMLLDGSTVDVAPILYDFFLDMSGYWLLGQRFSKMPKEEGDALEGPSSISSQQFLKSLHAAEFGVGMRIVFGWLGRHLTKRQFQENCQQVHAFLDHFIHKALQKTSYQKEDVPQKTMTHARGLESRGLLNALTQQASNTNLNVLRAQLLQTMMASQDTIPTLLSNTIFLLSRHPLVWKRLQEEVAPLRGREITADVLRSLPGLQNIIKESLRLYPVFFNMGRTAVRDTILPRGGGSMGEDPVIARKGDDIAINFYTLHRSKDTFGADAEAFKPERWQDVKCGRWEYLPFLEGTRRCAGQKLAMLQVSYCLAVMALRVDRIESRDDRPWAGEAKFTTKNTHGCVVALYTASPRSDE